MGEDDLLKGFCCPECGNEDSFWIHGTGRMLVYEDGVDEVENPEWDPKAECECPECGCKGKVLDFRRNAPREEDDE